MLHHLIFSLLASHLIQISAALTCADAPDESTQHLCRQMQHWERNARIYDVRRQHSIGRKLFAEAITDGSSVLDCRTIKCICDTQNGQMINKNRCILPNGRIYEKAIRKEYRLMSDDERTRFHNAFLLLNDAPQNPDVPQENLRRNTLFRGTTLEPTEHHQRAKMKSRNHSAIVQLIKQLHTSPVPSDTSVYERLAVIHTSVSLSPGAHAGPGFLVFHREFTKRRLPPPELTLECYVAELEISLRLIDPDLYLPYWDSTLDSRIPDSNQSCIYTDELQGQVNSTFYVTSGPFKYWRGRTGNPIYRTQGFRGRMYSDADVQIIMNFPNITDILGFTTINAKCPFKTNFGSFEYRHGNPHNFIAGDMWLTSRFERETQFPEDNPDCSAPAHFGDRTMTPFAPLLNRDGLSNVYTDELYEYAPRPSCSAREPSCGSKFLFCDISHGAPRCASKIKTSGRCSGYTSGESPCFGGSCVQGICVASTVMITTTTTPTMTNTIQPTSVPLLTASTTSRIRTTTVTTTPSSITATTCTDNNQYCQSWADHGHCDLNPEYMLQNCRLSCRIC